MRVFLAACAVALLLSGCGSNPAPPPTTAPPPTAKPTSPATVQWKVKPEEILVRPTDLPPGFTLDPQRTGPRSNDQAANLERDSAAVLANYEKWGRVDGYGVYYQRIGADISAGTLGVGAEVSLYKTIDGAHSALTAFEEAARASNRAPITLREVGDESSAFKFAQMAESGASKVEWTIIALGFRKGNVVGVVSTLAASNVANTEDIQKAAEAMAARIN